MLDYISRQILLHQKLEMLGITWKCIWEHEILQRKILFLMTQLHVQFYIFLKYKTWGLKGSIFPLILWFLNLKNTYCGRWERISVRPLSCLHNTCWIRALPILQPVQSTLDPCTCSSCHPEIIATGTSTQAKQQIKPSHSISALQKWCDPLE